MDVKMICHEIETELLCSISWFIIFLQEFTHCDQIVFTASRIVVSVLFL
jgi:hypothetical protein